MVQHKKCIFTGKYSCQCWACGDEYESESKDSHYCLSCIRDPFGVATYSGNYEYTWGSTTASAYVDENGMFTLIYD